MLAIFWLNPLMPAGSSLSHGPGNIAVSGGSNLSSPTNPRTRMSSKRLLYMY